MVTRTPEETYDYFTHNWCDIGQHLPRLRQEAHGNVVEIGTRDGASTSALLLGVREHGGHVWSIDVEEWCGRIFPPDPQWTFIHGNSRSEIFTIQQRIPSVIDLLFIDGDHCYEAVKSDLETYGPRVRGLIMLHDVLLEGAGVYQAAMEHGMAEVVPGDNGLGIIRRML